MWIEIRRLQEPSDLGLHCLSKILLNHFSRQQSRRQLLWLALYGLRSVKKPNTAFPNHELRPPMSKTLHFITFYLKKENILKDDCKNIIFCILGPGWSVRSL